MRDDGEEVRRDWCVRRELVSVRGESDDGGSAFALAAERRPFPPLGMVGDSR